MISQPIYKTLDLKAVVMHDSTGIVPDASEWKPDSTTARPPKVVPSRTRRDGRAVVASHFLAQFHRQRPTAGLQGTAGNTTE